MRFVARSLIVLTLAGLLAGCREQLLYSGLAQREANEMMALLKRAGLDAKLTAEARGGTLSVAVPQQQSVAAVDLLSRAGLPRQKSPTMPELLPKDTWMLSPVEERAKLAYALSQEMTGTLRQIAGINDVRVHLAPADRNALGQIVTQPTASVLVRYDADIIGPDFADNIRSLVASGMSGLTFERVSVVMMPQDMSAAAASAGLQPAKASAAAPSSSPVPSGPTPAAATGGALTSLPGLVEVVATPAVLTKWVAALLLAAAMAALLLRVARVRR